MKRVVTVLAVLASDPARPTDTVTPASSIQPVQEKVALGACPLRP